MDIPAEFMSATINAFEVNKRLADRAVGQVPDDKLHVSLDEDTNSIAVIMKHIAGNLVSRWTDFLTTDGEKPWRNRDDEFLDSFSSRAELLEFWERGWACLLETLKGPKPEDLGKTVLIRGEPHPVPLSIERSLGHILGPNDLGCVLHGRIVPREGSSSLAQSCNKLLWSKKKVYQDGLSG